MNALDLESFNELDPQAFYLGRRRQQLEATADVMLVVEGTCLPAHSQVLQLHSELFGAMLVDLGCKRKRQDEKADDLVVLEAPFAGYSVFQVSAYLRLLYDHSWWQAVPDTLGALGDSLSALLRLAHQFDSPDLLAALTKHMADSMVPVTFSQLCLWIKVAGDCQLEELRLGLLSRLARRLVVTRQPLLDTLALVSSLECLDVRTLWQLIGITAAGGAAPEEVAAACDKASKTYTHEWTLQRCSQLPLQQGTSVESPAFQFGGHKWRLTVYPGGHASAAGCLSVSLDCESSGVRAEYEVAVLDQEHVPREVRPSGGSGQPCVNFSNLGSLRCNGWLPGDCLRLRARVTVLPNEAEQ